MNKKHFFYQMPTRIFFNFPYLEILEKESNQLGKRFLLISGKRFVFKSGIMYKIKQVYERNSIQITLFNQVTPEPTVELVEAGKELARNQKVDVIIAVGGGSVIDVAKLVAASCTNPEISVIKHTDNGKIQSCEWRGKNKSLELIAIPTTAGSGSEVSRAAVIIDPRHKIKCSLKSQFFYPTTAIIDPTLTLTLPQENTIFSAIDALSHLVEGYLSLGASEMTDILAVEGIKLITQNLPKVMKEPRDLKARKNLMLASTYGGIVDSNAGLGIDHVLAHVIGARYNIPHGLACALLLPHVIDFNAKAQKDKLAQLSRALGRKEKISSLIFSFFRNGGLKFSLRKFGVPKEDFSGIAETAYQNQGALSFNPQKVTIDDIYQLLQKIY